MRHCARFALAAIARLMAGAMVTSVARSAHPFSPAALGAVDFGITENPALAGVLSYS